MQQIKKIPSQHNYGTVKTNNELLKANKCIKTLLGDKVDIKWDIQRAEMELSVSQNDVYSYERNQKQQIFRGVPFLHSKECELLDEHFQKNQKSHVLPCAVVMIKHRETKCILGTQRHQKMSFGNQWVLPGGHLQKGETIMEGGLRQCQQEVGLKNNQIIIRQNPQMMLWESVLANEANDKIKRVALVVFFSIESDHFEVQQQKKQVKRWQWRKFEEGQYPWGGDWAEGHLSYLSYLAQKNK